MLFDSHCHLNFNAYNDDRKAVIKRCQDAKMLVMNVGAALDTSKFGVDLALENDSCYASVGLHPIHVYEENFKRSAYQKLIDQGGQQVRAVGESGIDLWHIKNQSVSLDDLIKKQKRLFEQHIDLAKKNDLALIIHGRNGKENETAYEKIYAIVKERGVTCGVVHCFGGKLDEARAFIDLGLNIGLTGNITYDKTGVVDEMIRTIPLDCILIETDAPYLAPGPYRGKRNEPVYVIEVAKHIASVKNLSIEEVVKETGRNASKLYKISQINS